MDAEIKKLWVEGLRSGLYKQGKGELYNPTTEKYCCLGVLADVCEILQPDGSVVVGEERNISDLSHCPILKDELPSGVQRYLMICNDNEKIYGIGRPSYFLDISKDFDEHPSTFEEIAQFIETYL